MDDVKKIVRENYARIARAGGSCCAPGPSEQAEASRRAGYADGRLRGVPAGADLGLGCGSPVDRARLRPGEAVLDLGSGPGMDALLAAREVGPEGQVVGVDMTPEMIAHAQANATEAKVANVRFLLGELERLPRPDAWADAVISNCVVNLCPDKRAVYAEIFRVLKPGGRVCIADVLQERALPEELARDSRAWCA
ncbi:methyltransferase domain-containing protein [Desulfovibrio aminophilus]|nr:methyltransferase domain-containing protein [Desulfovibrio aminophilus]MCM0755176.1 methyltransferase domain-containing protein [Desulfovibrio aminophilus]